MKEDNGKILGIIGGMGPLATQLFYKMIIENTKAKCDQDHINMIILNHATMPDRTEAIKNGTTQEVLDKLVRDARYLEEGGADYVAIPCNTSHTMIEDFQDRTNLQVINMVESTVEYVEQQFSGKVGILATDGTIETELYQKECISYGLEPVIPSENAQKSVMKIIYDGIKNGGKINYKEFLAVEKEMKDKGCQCVIMACTELSYFKEMYDLPDYYVDAMEIMARKAIRLCGKKEKRGKK